MCGIAGFFRTDGTADHERLHSMCNTLVHRGPDDSGEYVRGGLGLGHRRLSIIDLGGGHQPMQTTDARFVIVYNGEIYNYRELKKGLQARGAEFRTNSDTEVILHLHAIYGDEAIAKLNGIFAYALWDRDRRRLLLVRDRAGIKPLYYATGPWGVAFASEIKALFKSGLVEARLDVSAVPEYLVFRQIAGSRNLFSDVAVLPPACSLEVVDGRVLGTREYWSPRHARSPFAGSYDDAVEATDAALNRAVQRQMIADVPLGTFCSGGIDSSLTTAIAARHSSQTINTFSVGFHEADWDESRYATMAASACHTKHHELRVDEREYAELLPQLIWHHDLPLNFANSVHIFAISRLARQHVTVVLTGEGADELFGGYPRYYIPRLLERIGALPRFVGALMLGCIARAPDSRLRKLAHYARQSEEEQLLFNCTNTNPSAAAALMLDPMPLSLNFRQECIDASKSSGLDSVSNLALLDFQTYLVSILNRQDKMSMATSIEARVPFLDNELVDLAFSLPLEYKQTYRHRKRVLKDVALRYLPAEIVHRRKSGFGVPLSSWFAAKGPMAELLGDTLQSQEARATFDISELERLHTMHREGAGDHSELLWGVLNLCLWRRAYAV